jgi:hypothetical protein
MCRWGQPLCSERSHRSFRPLTVLGLRLDYALGGLRPEGYHAVNIALHAAASAQCVFVCARLLGCVPCSTARVATACTLAGMCFLHLQL